MNGIRLPATLVLFPPPAARSQAHNYDSHARLERKISEISCKQAFSSRTHCDN